jgi:hypothetical protein
MMEVVESPYEYTDDPDDVNYDYIRGIEYPEDCDYQPDEYYSKKEVQEEFLYHHPYGSPVSGYEYEYE